MLVDFSASWRSGLFMCSFISQDMFRCHNTVTSAVCVTAEQHCSGHKSVFYVVHTPAAAAASQPPATKAPHT